MVVSLSAETNSEIKVVFITLTMTAVYIAHVSFSAMANNC